MLLGTPERQHTAIIALEVLLHHHPIHLADVHVCLVDSPLPLTFSTAQRPHRDSNKDSVHPVGQKRSRGGRWREHVCWHVDSGSCRSTRSLRIPGTFANAPSARRSLCTHYIRDA